MTGGCYRELCERPHWNAIFGSGGRAAAALARISPSIELYTYCHPKRLEGPNAIQDRGVLVHPVPSKQEISFAYFHPLSSPGIEPNINRIASEKPITCRGKVILRFGFLEGDAIVHGETVVYDPQTLSKPCSFEENGSSAKRLALVLNAEELLQSVGGETIETSATALVARENADVVVVKCGARGAAVIEKGKDLIWVSAFRTPGVFKIGSGDVFSATFAHYWGIKETSAAESAELASRCTATYCASRHLPIPSEDELPEFPPVNYNAHTKVGVVGNKNSLANQWLIEETLWCLNKLGQPAKFVDFTLEEGKSCLNTVDSVLVLADTLEDYGIAAIESARKKELSLVALHERENTEFASSDAVSTTDDFTTAIYWTVWA